MGTGRDLNRTRERIMGAGVAEFSAHGFAGARTDAIAQRAGVNERMIFYCFKTKEGLYREVLRRKVAERVSLLESNPNDDFASRLAKGYELACSQADGVRMLEWEALAGGKRKLVDEDERRDLFRMEAAQLRRAKVRGQIPSDSNEQMLLLISFALRMAPLAFPQITWLISGMEPGDPKFRRKWMKSLRWVGERIAGQPGPQPQPAAAPEPPSEVTELVQ
jgi:TetR/AcrR family transcriptional regulator